MTLKKSLDIWQEKYNCQLFQPVATTILGQVINSLGPFPDELIDLYKDSNGLFLNWFQVLPIEDPKHIRRTWDSIQKANNTKKTAYLTGDTTLLMRFFVFADLGSRTCAVIDRQDHSIWYEEDGELHQTDFALSDFIEACLKEASD